MQGAQKVLENLTLQQQQNQLAPTSQQPQTFTPSVTPGGQQQQGPQQPPQLPPLPSQANAQPEAGPEGDSDAQHQHHQGSVGTVPSLISIYISVLQSAATVEHCTISPQFAFQSSFLRCSEWVSNGE